MLSFCSGLIDIRTVKCAHACDAPFALLSHDAQGPDGIADSGGKAQSSGRKGTERYAELGRVRRRSSSSRLSSRWTHAQLLLISLLGVTERDSLLSFSYAVLEGIAHCTRMPILSGSSARRRRARWLCPTPPGDEPPFPPCSVRPRGPFAPGALCCSFAIPAVLCVHRPEDFHPDRVVTCHASFERCRALVLGLDGKERHLPPYHSARLDL